MAQDEQTQVDDIDEKQDSQETAEPKEDNTSQQDAPQDTPADEPADEAPKEDSPEQSEEAPTEAPKAEASQEDFDIDEYWKRYNVEDAPKSDQGSLADRLSKVDQDEDGNADATQVAKVFEDWQAQVEQNAIQRARQEFLGFKTEESELNALKEKFPEVTKDRELFNTVADLRDAAALRGETLSLTKAAEKLFKREQAARQDATKQATRTREVQASAHLETSATPSADNPNEQEELIGQMASRNPTVAKEARSKLLKSYVSDMIKRGEIS